MQPAAEQPAVAEEGAPLPSAPGTAPAAALAIPPMPAGSELAFPNAHVACFVDPDHVHSKAEAQRIGRSAHEISATGEPVCFFLPILRPEGSYPRCLLVAGWKPGDPLPGIPAMPPGWKPGDPIPLPGGADAQAAPTGQPGAAQPAAPAAPPAQEAGSLQKPPPPRPLLQRPVFDADFLMLGEDNEAVEEDFSSEEDSDE